MPFKPKEHEYLLQMIIPKFYKDWLDEYIEIYFPRTHSQTKFMIFLLQNAMRLVEEYPDLITHDQIPSVPFPYYDPDGNPYYPGGYEAAKAERLEKLPRHLEDARESRQARRSPESRALAAATEQNAARDREERESGVERMAMKPEAAPADAIKRAIVHVQEKAERAAEPQLPAKSDNKRPNRTHNKLEQDLPGSLRVRTSRGVLTAAASERPETPEETALREWLEAGGE